MSNYIGKIELIKAARLFKQDCGLVEAKDFVEAALFTLEPTLPGGLDPMDYWGYSKLLFAWVHEQIAVEDGHLVEIRKVALSRTDVYNFGFPNR
jgi:hypothetical protein